MSDLEYLPSGIVVIPPELLEKASPEEREAYFQYIVEKVIEADDWELWVKTFFPSVADRPFSNAHREFWEWVWEVDRDNRPTPWVSVWPRGFAKSTSTELAVTALAARGKRRYGLYVCHEKGTPILDPDTGKWMSVEEHPTAWERHCDGHELRVWGLPFSETITPEHRYWGMEITRRDLGHGRGKEVTFGTQDWVEAQNLTKKTWIGLPIDQSVESVPEWMDDPNLWWVIGLWWGDGTSGGPNRTQLSFSMGDAHPEHFARLTSVLDGFGIKWNTRRQVGCTDVYFTHHQLAEFLNEWRTGGNSQKTPPQWVERIPTDLQAELIKGYVAADGWVTDRDVQVASVSLDGLLSARRILARLGIPATIKQVHKAGPSVIMGRMHQRQASYALRFQQGASTLGYPVDKNNSYSYQKVFIQDNHLWSQVRSIEDAPHRIFIPITTSTSSYTTAFGLSHNCETQEQADDHVANVAALLTNPTLELAYPELGEKLLDKHGNSKGWRRNRIRTGAGFTLDAMGLDSAARGVKLEDQRPDFICHEVGTEIIDGDWSGKVEDHPGLLAINEARGLEINIWGTPDAEVVTQEHKYWAREMRPRRRESHLNTTPGWVEARDLSGRHFIGTPINQDVIDPPTVLKYFPGRNISRDEKGRISTSSGEFEQFLPEEFNDPEWWWFFGLWWGDGSNTSRHAVQVTIADHEPHIFERLSALLDRYEMPFFVHPQVGCFSVTIYNTWMSVWLQTWRYELEGQSKAGLKCPPRWVESISHEFQAQLMRGYVDADGYVTNKEVKITSVSELGLQAAKRILARLGIASSIRNLREAGTVEIRGITATTKRAYDLRFGAGAEALDIHLDLTDRYRFGRVFIEDGFLWSKVRQISDAGWRKFAPIDVGGDHTYLTRFGLSHNCLDDIDGELDTEDRTAKKIKTITRKIIPAGSQDCAVLMVQNLVHENSVFAQLVDGRADFLRDRNVSGPIPAIWNMDYEERDGKFVITGGEPSWPEGFPISSCQLLMNDIGLSAFLAECQHETKPPEGDVFSHINFARCSWDDVPKLKKTVVWVDPAVTSTDSSDSMGIHCDGLGTDGKIYRLWSWENRANPYAAIRLAVTKAIELNADVVGIEVNQGRDLWRGVYDQVCEDIRKEGEDYYRRLPRYKESIATKDLGSKIARAQRMLVDYERGVFVHVEGTHTTLEMALRRFPKVKPYDLVDSSFWAWNEIAGGMHRKKSRVSSAKGRRTTSSI